MKTTVDWLTFRTQAEPKKAQKSLAEMFGVPEKQLQVRELSTGQRGFEKGQEISIGPMPVGRMDYGGAAMRGWCSVAISGKGCEWVTDWEAIHAVQELDTAQIRRLDIALTTWKGEIGHDMVVDAHARGRFAGASHGGRPPALQQIISTDPRAGRTCYVGKRTAGKFFRAYEKGFEMAAKFRDAVIQEIDGHQVEDIYRCELELKAATLHLPWTLIPRRDNIFAGAYPFLADVMPSIQADVLERKKARGPQADLAAALENCRIQFGPTLFTALMAFEGDISAVWEKVVGKKHCETLLRAGVMLVEHD